MILSYSSTAFSIYFRNSDSSRFIDSKTLYNYTYKTFSKKNIVNKNDIIQTIEVPNGTKETKNLNLIVENDINALININEEISQPTVKLNENILAPIAPNEKLGTVTYNINGIEYTQNLVAETTVEQDLFFIKLSIIALCVLIILLLILIIKSKTKKNKKRKYKSNY